MLSAIDSLLHLLDLEPTGVDCFVGKSPAFGWRRVFGGQVVAQSLVAAGRSVDGGRLVHSLHGYFLRPGNPDVPIIYQVERERDGKSFSTRRVVAVQEDLAIFSMSASYHLPEDGFHHHEPMPPDVPHAEDLPSEQTFLNELLSREMPPHIRKFWDRERPVELRPVNPRNILDPAVAKPLSLVWFRARGSLNDDPDIHRAILTYATDFTLLDTALIPHGFSTFDKRLMVASLDHSVWIHRPFRMDEWLLYVQTSTNASGARGFTRGSVFTENGTLIASVAQEGLIRRLTR